VTVWSEIFLGVIAAATLMVAVVLVGVLVAAGRLARRIGRLLDRLEPELTPLMGHLNAIGRDASRAAALAAGQVERVDRLFGDLAQRLDQVLRAFQDTFVTPAREGRAILAALFAIFQTVRGARTRRSRAEDEDALFI
jgi:hypothetical protein